MTDAVGIGISSGIQYLFSLGSVTNGSSETVSGSTSVTLPSLDIGEGKWVIVALSYPATYNGNLTVKLPSGGRYLCADSEYKCDFTTPSIPSLTVNYHDLLGTSPYSGGSAVSSLHWDKIAGPTVYGRLRVYYVRVS